MYNYMFVCVCIDGLAICMKSNQVSKVLKLKIVLR